MQVDSKRKEVAIEGERYRFKRKKTKKKNSVSEKNTTKRKKIENKGVCLLIFFV